MSERFGEFRRPRRMQSSTQSNPCPDPLTTATTLNQLDKDTEALPVVNEPDTQEQKDKSAVPLEAEIGTVWKENGSDRDPADSIEFKSKAENEPAAQQQTQPSGHDGGMELNAASKPSLPCGPVFDINTSSGCGLQEDKYKAKSVSDGRKYVPSKKAMIDPLKMDMSKPLLMPLTSSQMSLQCIECHIIFRDHKSKVRHLKLSHPAEYEQCMLKNSFFACYVCDRHFTNSTELMAHQKAHIEKKPFTCPICNLAFKKSSELTVHKKVHFASGGYACTECGKPCKTMTLLKYHLRTHTGERPFVCLDCGKRFTRPKLLHTHMLLHSPMVLEGNNSNLKLQGTKDDGSFPKYHCSICKIAFKTPKTRLRHMKNKHKVLLANGNTLPPEQQEKQNTPIITPLSFGQAGLLQVVPNGPLQKVDAKVDTEQICRLIESLGNVQKVNQVVILGQVPPNAPPLEVHQIPQVAESVDSNLNPLQLHFMGMKPTESEELGSSNNQCDPMEQTIILEPITPDGQLETNPLFQGICSEVTISESIQVTLGHSGQTETSSGELMHQGLQQTDVGVGQFNTVNQIVCQNEGDAQIQNLEETFILELTPALTPTMELEQNQTVSQNEIPLPISEVTTDIQKIPDQTNTLEQETTLTVQQRLHKAELEYEALQEKHQDCPIPVVPQKTLQNPTETEANVCEAVDLAHQEVNQDLVHNPDRGVLQGTEEKTNTASEILHEMSIEGQEEVKDSCETVNHLSKDEALPQQETRQTTQVSELPVSVMSAQELVKVRKRKPARAFFLQGYMQDFVGSMRKDDLHVRAQPVKRKRTKKSHLVVKFGPQDKEKKSKEKTPSQKCKKKQEDAIKGKNILEKKKGRKGKHGKKAEVSAPLAEEMPSTQEAHVQMQPVKEGARKSKVNKQRESGKNLAHESEHKVVSLPGFKKKKQAKVIQKGTMKNAEGGNEKKKQLDKEVGRPTLPNIPGQTLPQDALLLLKGHKQPQLKVYKLDTSKSSGQTPSSSPGSQQSQDKELVNTTINSGTPQGKKKGRPKKNPQAFSILSSLKVTNKAPEVLPPKPETTRKRKASTKVETEGVITSKRALECNDCGEIFGEVSSLQKHKTTVHVIESPGLTYTNGNIFEGVTRLDLYQLPKQCLKDGGIRNAAAPDWDTEPETGDMISEDREPSLSFPALIPSPSLPVPLSDNGINADEDKGASKKEMNNSFQTSVDADLPSDQVQNDEKNNVQSHEREEPMTLDHNEPGAGTIKKLNPKTQVRHSTEEEVKENLLLQVDLVTVGDQAERDELAPIEDAEAQILSQESCHKSSQFSWQERSETEQGLHLQAVSCSTRGINFKEEEEEIAIQKRKGGGEGAVARNAKLKKGKGKICIGDALSKRDLAVDAPPLTYSEKAQPECQVVYERHVFPLDSESHGQREPASMNSKAEVIPEHEANKPSSLEESSKKQGVTQSKLATTSVEELNEDRQPLGLKEQDRDQSPIIILEKILTSRHQTTDVRKQNGQRQGWEAHANSEVRASRRQDIKVEEHTSDSSATAASSQNRLNAVMQPQHHRDIRTVFVKEESPLLFNEVSSQVNKHDRWNIEPATSGSAASPLMESAEITQDSNLTPELSTSQCIFYPVKEEEKEVLLCGPQSSSGIFHNNLQADLQEIDIQSDEGSNSTHNYTRRKGNNAETDAEADTEWRQSPDLQDFLLQSSDEEDVCDLEFSDPQMDLEVNIMAYFDNNPRNNKRPIREKLSNLLHSSHPQTPREEDRINEPINNFSQYLGWKTWVEIANWTNARCSMLNPVSAREVAQFVGIHIAMGTLKFPSLKLYWKDLTKVPLIAEAMPLSRFLELTRMLKCAPFGKNSSIHDAQEETQGSECHIVQQDKDISYSFSKRQRKTLNNCCRPTTNPLRKVEPLLRRFRAGCQSMRRDADYAVDQYPLPLTQKMHNKNPALRCTAIIGFGGFIQHLDLKLGLSDEEDAVEQMVPGGSMVYLCKQELSTPAMLERLLVAGVHGAGRVGGARGQIGDEFVSSDGKLMLRRSHSGFILSTAGNGQRDMASLVENFDKAQMSAQVNRDLQNLYTTPFTASAPTCWPQAVLWYLTDLSLINSWLLYRQNHCAAAAPLTLMAFRLEVSKALILSSGSHTQDACPPQPPIENVHTTNDAPNPTLVDHSPLPDAATRYDGFGHWPEQLGEGEGGRCRFRDCQRTSRVLCLKCCVFLCISRNNNCFWNFHNQKSMVK